MSIDHVSLRLQSRYLLADKLAKVAGSAPTISVNAGDPISSRNPQGHRHQVTTAMFSVDGDWDELAPYVRTLVPLLARIEGDPASNSYSVDLVVAVSSRPLGYMVDLSSQDLALLVRARSGLVFDVYSGDEKSEDVSDG